MDLVLKTRRLVLRPAVPSDLEMTLDLLCDPRVMKYAGGARSTEAVLQEWPNSLKRGAGGALGVWTIFLRSGEEPIGRGVLLPLPVGDAVRDWSQLDQPGLPEDPVEVGYLLKPAAWGLGHATEVTQRLLQFAFEQTTLEEVVGVINPEHEASASVLRKTGMVEQAPGRAYGADVRWFSVTRRDWQANRREPA